MSFEKALIKWAIAHEIADENPGLLLSSTWTQANSDLCAQRMRDLDIAEQELLDFDDPRVLPYKQAKADSACGACWVSSSSKKKHAECDAKIDRYFATRDALIAEGLKLNASRPA